MGLELLRPLVPAQPLTRQVILSSILSHQFTSIEMVMACYDAYLIALQRPDTRQALHPKLTNREMEAQRDEVNSLRSRSK